MSKFNKKWDIKCCECGRFISNDDLMYDRVHKEYIPDSIEGNEEVFFTCMNCHDLVGIEATK